MDTKISGVSGEISQVKSDLSNTKTTVSSLQEIVTGLTENLEDQVNNVISSGEFGTKLEDLQYGIENNTASIEETNATVEEVKDNITEIENNINELNESLNDSYYIWHGEDDTEPSLTNEPAVNWSNLDKKNHEGDFYINSLGYCWKFINTGGTNYSWELIEDRYIVPYAKQIEKKSIIFISQPTIDDFYNPGDLWINATYTDISGNELYKNETLVCVSEKVEGENFDIDQWEPANLANLESVKEVSDKIDEYQKRTILLNKEELFKEDTWKDASGGLWIYEGLIISVINDQKLYLLVNKDRYTYEDGWVEIGKTLSLTWGNITDKPDYLDSLDSDIDTINGNIESLTQTVEDYNANLTDRLDVIEYETIEDINKTLIELDEQLRESYYIWHGEDDTEPALNNEPAVNWNDSLKRSHLGDFFINSLGYCWKFVQEGSVFKWKLVEDRYIVPYAKQIEKKSSIFIAQPTSEDRYKVGDLWINATYTEPGSTEPLYEKAVLVCVEGKEEGEDFNIDQWELSEVASASSVEGVEKTVEDYRTRVIINNKSQLFKEETWLTPSGNLWIYEGLVISVINDQKLYLLVNKDRYIYEDGWIEIGKTISLTWENITDKPDLAPEEHYHENYENSILSIENNITSLQESTEEIKEVLDNYEYNTIPKIEENLEKINNTLINQFYIWHGEDDSIPNASNYPEIEWITVDDKLEHVGDFYITIEGFCYKYVRSDAGNFSWELVSDRYIVSYAQKIEQKTTIFTEAPEEDDSYKPGDLWVNAFYIDENGVRVFNNDIVICTQGKEVGESFNYGDWQAIIKADDVNIDNTALTVGSNQTISGHKTFAVPIYFGPKGTGPTDNEEDPSPYKELYSTVYNEDGNFTIEAGKQLSSDETLTMNIKNSTGGGINIQSTLTEEFKSESGGSGNIAITNNFGGDINIQSTHEATKAAGRIYLRTKGGKNDRSKDDNLGLYLDPQTHSASIYNQDTIVTNLCDGYAEVSGFDGFAITSKADSSKKDMTGVRFKWIKEDVDGNPLNTLDIHKVSNETGTLVTEALNIKINNVAEVLTSANYESYLTGQSNTVNFISAYSTNDDPIMQDGSSDVSEKLKLAINECISNNSKLIIPFGTYLLSSSIPVTGLTSSNSMFSIDANNSLFICDQSLVEDPHGVAGQTIENGGTGEVDNTYSEISEQTGALFTIGSGEGDLGTFEFRNARFRTKPIVSNGVSTATRTGWACFDINSQGSVIFDRLFIENYHTGIQAKDCIRNPYISRCKFTNNIIGLLSLGRFSNLSVEDCDFTGTGTGIYLSRNSVGEFASNSISHCIFEKCVRGIYGDSQKTAKAIQIRSSKFDSNTEFDILFKNHSIYPTIENVVFDDISTVIRDDEGVETEIVIPWRGRATIPVILSGGGKATAFPNELSNVDPRESALGMSHTADYTKTPISWGDCNISIYDNIFYDCRKVQIGNDPKGGHISGVTFHGNRVMGSIEQCIRICSDLPGNCSAVSVFGNSYQSTQVDSLSGKYVDLDFEAPIKSPLTNGSDYVPAGSLMARYSMGPSVPTTSSTKEGQIGDLRWDENKAYLKTETGWKVIQFTHTFDNNSMTRVNAKPIEIGAQKPATTEGYHVGDIVWNFGSDVINTLGWRLVKDSLGAVSWQTLEKLIGDVISSGTTS